MNRDTSRRFAYIETCLYWGEGINASKLAKTFEITRQNAQKCLDAYRYSHAEQMYYSASLKHHIATDSFKPHYISAQPEYYLDYLRGNQLTAYYWQDEEWGGLPVYDVDRLFKTHLDNNLVKQVLSAIAAKQTLCLTYHSKAQMQNLTISPNRLVYASRRYHVRSYCHDWKKYIDIVLSRIFDLQLGHEDWVSDQADQAWHKSVTLNFIPNPALPEQARQTLLIDHRSKLTQDAEHTLLTINTSGALEGYVLREMERVDWKYKVCLWVKAQVSD